jgi:hypothetical protein
VKNTLILIVCGALLALYFDFGSLINDVTTLVGSVIS